MTSVRTVSVANPSGEIWRGRLWAECAVEAVIPSAGCLQDYVVVLGESFLTAEQYADMSLKDLCKDWDAQETVVRRASHLEVTDREGNT